MAGKAFSLSQTKDPSYLEILVLKNVSKARDPRIQMNDVLMGLPICIVLNFLIICPEGYILSVSSETCSPFLPSMKPG